MKSPDSSSAKGAGMEFAKVDAGPWYREPWPWLLMAGPVAVVVAGIATIWIAVASSDGLVVDDYYKQGMAINQTIQRDTLAAQRGYRATAMVAGEGRSVTVELAAAAGAPLPDMLRLLIVHPTRAGMDGVVLLRQVRAGIYDGVIPALTDGRRILVLEDVQSAWRLTADAAFPVRDRIVLESANRQ